MINFIIARNESGNDHFESYLKPSLEVFGDKVKYKEIFNRDVPENNSIFSKYNLGIKKYEEEGIDENDIFVFSHADIKILDDLFCEKLEMIFSRKENVGVVGVIGSKSYNGNSWWSSPLEDQVGSIIQGQDKGTSFHMVKKIGYFDDVCVVDGCIFAVRSKVVKTVKFQEEIFTKSYHHYDITFCVDVLKNNWKVAVADISVEHASPGPISIEWHKSRNMSNKYIIDKGLTFPITSVSINS